MKTWNMYKRYNITIILFLFSKIGFCYDFCVNGIYYNITSTELNECEVTFKPSDSGEGEVVYNETISIPTSVTYLGTEYSVVGIGESAFRHSKIGAIQIPNTIRYISNDTFSYTTTIRSITIPESVTSIGNSAFFGSSIGDVEIQGHGLLKIGDEAFFECTSLKAFIMPNSVIQIGKDCFARCANLESIIIPQSVKTIGARAFVGCIKLTELRIPDSVISIGEAAFAGYTGGERPNITFVEIGNGLKEIKDIFWGMHYYISNPQLSKIVVGNAITSIHDGYAVFGSDYAENFNKTNVYLLTNNLVNLGSHPGHANCSVYVADSTKYSDSTIKTFGIRNIVSSNKYSGEYNGTVPNINFTSNLEGYNAIISPECYNVGTYSSMSVNFSKDDFSSTITVPCDYTITKAPLTITPDDISIYYGEDIPKFSCTYQGFKNNETASVALTTLPNITTAAKKGSDAGSYQLTASGAEAQNYALSYKNGTLTIKKALQTITWDQTFSNVYVGDQIELSAYSSCGLPISYTTSDSSIAFVTNDNGKQILHLLKTGVVKVSATQAGDKNHESAQELSKAVTIYARSATGISVSPTSATISEGESITLKATITPESVLEKGVKWHSSNEEVAIVQNGVVSGKKVGNATISATTIDGSNLSATCTITVIPILATSITMSQSSASLKLGESISLSAMISPQNTTNKDVKWNSSNESVATVDNGYVVAKGIGNSTISATTTDGTNLSTTCKITVNPILATSITMSQSSASIKLGESISLSATISPQNTTNKEIKWSSNDNTVASVDNKGNVSSLGIGIATITAETTDGSGIKATCKVTVNPITAFSVSLNTTSLNVYVDESYTLKATILPENTTNKNINWTSSDNTIATVSNGTIKGLKAGTATITAMTTDGTNLKATCPVTVKSKYATSITLNETSKSLTLGSTLQLEATVLPSDLENKTVTWKTSDATIASVSNGLVTAKNIGNATITATTTDGTNLSATCKITVTPVYVTSITLSHTSASLQLGEFISLTASIYPQNATKQDIVWSSSDDNVATVNNGYVTAKKIGRATITAETTDGSNQKATCTITVNAKLVSSISLNKTTVELTTGQSLSLAATVKPDDATYRDVEWSSSNGSVASVSNGKVTALAPGNTVITVKTIDGSNLSATCDVKVLPIYVTSISLEKESLELLVDETALLTASVYPDNASEKTVVWTSSDVSVVSIDEGFVKAEGAGVATITVKTADGTNLSASCKVTVNKHPQTIIWDQDLSFLEQWGELMELTASASSGLPITYHSSNEDVASILPLGTDLFYLNPGEAGMAEITVSQPGNDYYAPIEMKKFAIVKDPNSIANIPANQGKYTVYTMTGGKVGTYSKEEYKELIGKHKLIKGLYIINGIKVEIK